MRALCNSCGPPHWRCCEAIRTVGAAGRASAAHRACRPSSDYGLPSPVLPRCAGRWTSPTASTAGWPPAAVAAAPVDATPSVRRFGLGSGFAGARGLISVDCFQACSPSKLPMLAKLSKLETLDMLAKLDELLTFRRGSDQYQRPSYALRLMTCMVSLARRTVRQEIPASFACFSSSFVHTGQSFSTFVRPSPCCPAWR